MKIKYVFKQTVVGWNWHPVIDLVLSTWVTQRPTSIRRRPLERYHKYFDLTLDSGLRICGVESSDHVDSYYRLTLRRVDVIDPRCSVEYIQELARDFVDSMLDDFTAYASHKN